MAAFFGMATKYAEGLLAIRYRRLRMTRGYLRWSDVPHSSRDGREVATTGYFFAVAGSLVALFGIGTMTQVNSITGSQASFGKQLQKWLV